MSGPQLRVAAQVPVTSAEGPFLRYAIWVQGCTLACPGCCNTHFNTRDGGRPIDVPELVEMLARARRDAGIEGLTVLGGEPLQQSAALTRLCLGCRELGLGIIIFSGLERDELNAVPDFAQLWPTIDTLVTGRYRADRPEPRQSAGGRPLIGSYNQEILHQTARYAEATLWRGPARAELSCDTDGQAHIHGAPRLVQRARLALRGPSRPR